LSWKIKVVINYSRRDTMKKRLVCISIGLLFSLPVLLSGGRKGEDAPAPEGKREMGAAGEEIDP
jgi:hypothetical protein